MEFLSASRWVAMWQIAIFIYAWCKALTWMTRPPGVAPMWKHAAYLLAWPGMDSHAFLHGRLGRIQSPKPSEWAFAIAKLAIGLTLLTIAGSASHHSESFVVAWVGMTGIVFTLHFGLFHLLSCLWRSLGIPAAPIMNWPVASRNLSDFWGRRWNMAFRDLTHRLLFQPLKSRLGPNRALLTGFFISGLVHDLVITVPAGGGWGLPTCYFVIQGCGILFEHSNWGRHLSLNSGIPGWVYCLMIVMLPCPLLFPPAFLQEVILPSLQALEFQR